jgi:hypothetical protein
MWAFGDRVFGRRWSSSVLAAGVPVRRAYRENLDPVGQLDQELGISRKMMNAGRVAASES